MHHALAPLAFSPLTSDVIVLVLHPGRTDPVVNLIMMRTFIVYRAIGKPRGKDNPERYRFDTVYELHQGEVAQRSRDIPVPSTVTESIEEAANPTLAEVLRWIQQFPDQVQESAPPLKKVRSLAESLLQQDDAPKPFVILPWTQGVRDIRENVQSAVSGFEGRSGLKKSVPLASVDVKPYKVSNDLHFTESVPVNPTLASRLSSKASLLREKGSSFKVTQSRS